METHIAKWLMRGRTRAGDRIRPDAQYRPHPRPKRRGGVDPDRVATGCRQSQLPRHGRPSAPTFAVASPGWAMLLATALAANPSASHAQEADYRVLGSADAPVEMAILSDFECPYCRNFALAALPALFAEFVDRGLLRLRFVYFPLAGLHDNAVIAAKAAHCAGMAGRFWPYHDYVFVRQPEWAGQQTPDSLWVAYATNLGIDPDGFSACLASEATHAVVEADLREALGAGATGTPTVVLNGRPISGIGSYEALRQEILAAIEEARR